VDRRHLVIFLVFQTNLAFWIYSRAMAYFSPDLASNYFWIRVSFAPICLLGTIWLTFSTTGAAVLEATG
jgi:hypothetical protein